MPDVDVLLAGEAARRRGAPEQDGVLGLLVIDGEVDADAVEEPRLEAHLELLAALGLEVGIADGLRRHGRLVVRPRARPVGPEGGERLGLDA
jgi:hypothetical protein